MVQAVSSPLHFLKISFDSLTLTTWEALLSKDVVVDSDELGKVILHLRNPTWGSSRTQPILSIHTPTHRLATSILRRWNIYL